MKNVGCVLILHQNNEIEDWIELLNNKLHGLLPPGGLVSPSGGFASLSFDQGVPKNSQHHLADWNAICILHRSDCAWLWCLLSQLVLEENIRSCHFTLVPKSVRSNMKSNFSLWESNNKWPVTSSPERGPRSHGFHKYNWSSAWQTPFGGTP